jgi:hypothetical protein
MRLAKFMFVLLIGLHAIPAYADEVPPKLVLQITVDQLRGDLPMRFKDRLGDGGFRFLLNSGTHYINAHYKHANPNLTRVSLPGIFLLQPSGMRL